MGSDMRCCKQSVAALQILLGASKSVNQRDFLSARNIVYSLGYVIALLVVPAAVSAIITLPIAIFKKSTGKPDVYSSYIYLYPVFWLLFALISTLGTITR